MEALLLTSEDAAGCLNIGHSKVYDLMRAGALEAVRIGARRRVPLPRWTPTSSNCVSRWAPLVGRPGREGERPVGHKPVIVAHCGDSAPGGIPGFYWSRLSESNRRPIHYE